MMKGYFTIIRPPPHMGLCWFYPSCRFRGMNSIVVWRFCFSTVFCLAIMLIKKILFQATPRQIGVMIVVGILDLV